MTAGKASPPEPGGTGQGRERPTAGTASASPTQPATVGGPSGPRTSTTGSRRRAGGRRPAPRPGRPAGAGGRGPRSRGRPPGRGRRWPGGPRPAERGPRGDQPPRRERRPRCRGDDPGRQRAEADHVGHHGRRGALQAGVVGPPARHEDEQQQPGHDAEQQREDDGQRRRRRAPPTAAARGAPPPWTTGLSARADGAVAVGVEPVVAPPDGRLTCEDGDADAAPPDLPGTPAATASRVATSVTATVGPRWVARTRARARAGPPGRARHIDHALSTPPMSCIKAADLQIYGSGPIRSSVCRGNLGTAKGVTSTWASLSARLSSTRTTVPH